MGIETTARSRELGAELKRHRDSAGLRCEQVGAMMGLSANTVSRMERGHRVPSEIEATIFLAVCGASRSEIEDLLAVCRAIESEHCWMRPHVEKTANALRTLIMAESTATVIQNYQPLLVPGLLQTHDYATTVTRGLAGMVADQVANRVATRMRRQELLHGSNAPRCFFFMNEAALKCPVGGPRVMQEQMLHLMFLGDQPHITIRVVPTSAGAHAGMSGSFMMMHYAEHRPVVLVETETVSLFHESSTNMEIYRVILSELSRCALDESDSRGLFADFANQHDRELLKIGLSRKLTG